MKKLLTVTAVLLLALTLLWGCKENPDTQADIPLFYNLDRGASLTADEAGSYSVRFAQGAQIETYKVTDESLLTKILKQDFLGLILEGDTVTGMVSMWDMPYQRLARDYSVQSIGGKLVKLNSSISNAGDEIMLELSEDVPVYDFSSLSTTPGTTTALQKNDRASVIADENGNVKFVYVTYRAATLGTEKILCQHCESNVYWYDWFSDTDLPTTNGHYILKCDVNMATTAKIGSGDICLDLNGKTVTLSGNAKITGNEGSNLWIDGFAKVYIGDEGLGADAKIGITMEEPGTFITDVPDGVDISKYFISDDASKKIVKTGDGWTIK